MPTTSLHRREGITSGGPAHRSPCLDGCAVDGHDDGARGDAGARCIRARAHLEHARLSVLPHRPNVGARWHQSSRRCGVGVQMRIVVVQLFNLSVRARRPIPVWCSRPSGRPHTAAVSTASCQFSDRSTHSSRRRSGAARRRVRCRRAHLAEEQEPPVAAEARQATRPHTTGAIAPSLSTHFM